MKHSRPTKKGPGASKRRHNPPEGHETKNKKAGMWIDVPPKQPKTLNPYSGPSIQIGVINIGKGKNGIEKQHAVNYVPAGMISKDKGDHIELWSPVPAK